MTDRVRPYQYYDVAVSICAQCLRRVDAKIVFQDEAVWMHKRCPEHGSERVLIADDLKYWRMARERFLKPSEMPRRFQTPVRYGCPYDCGLCADHEQHSCLTLVELGDPCNLECPICYAGSGPAHTQWHSLETIRGMLDAIVASEGEPDIVQLSGGEPTLHPEFFEVLAEAKRRPIRHLMLNTNGIRIAKEEGFAERLASFAPGFEVYLQFDSLNEGPLRELRGADLREIRREALERLNALGLSTTLVVTVKKGTNDHELGSILAYALEQPCVRGVTYQPIQDAGRTEAFQAAEHRLTLTEVRRRILEQSDVFRDADLLPVPCHPDAIAMGYALKTSDGVQPLTRFVDPELLLNAGSNTIRYEGDGQLHKHLFDALSTAHGPESSAASLASLLCCLPHVELSPELPSIGYENVFRVIVMQFLDAHSFDVRSVKKSCVHIVHPQDGRVIPFDTYNLFYRGNLEREILEPLRRGVESNSPVQPS